MHRHIKTTVALALLLGLTVCRSTCGGSQKAESTPPTPAFVGRFMQDPNNPEAKLFAWSQSTIMARFVGTQVAVRLQDLIPQAGRDDGPNHFDIIVDDRPPFVLPMRDQQSIYTLARDLPQGTHTVTLVKRTEALVGTARFSGFDFGSEGHMLLPPKHPDRRLLVIGDSISAGYGNEGKSEQCHFSPTTENSNLAYGPIAARALGAEVHVIAWSGKGVYRNRDMSQDSVMPRLQERILPKEAGTVWNPNDYVPHAIIINLGTNDFGHDVAPEQPFEDAYQGLVKQLRAAYPNAYIVLALGPMLEDSDKNHHQLTEARRMVQTVVERLHAAQVQKVGFLEFPTQRGEHGFGCDYHPSLVTHAQMGAQLAASLKATLGW